MQRMWIAAVAMFAFGLGCVAASFVVPPVRAGMSPTKWEYFCPHTTDEEVDKWNKAGAQGWEMVSINLAQQLCFKRPLP